MAENEKDDTGGILSSLGQVAAIGSGLVMGYEAGEGLTHIVQEYVDMTPKTAEIVEDGMELAGAVTVAYAASRLAEKNPEEAVLRAAAALGGVAAVTGVKGLIDKTEQQNAAIEGSRDETRDLHAAVDKMSGQPDHADENSTGSLFSDAPVERPDDIFQSPQAADPFDPFNDPQGQIAGHNDDQFGNGHFGDYPSPDA